MEERIDRLEEKVDKITDNHLAHMKDEISVLNTGLSVVSTNVLWLMKTYWVVVSASVGSLVAALLGLIVK